MATTEENKFVYGFSEGKKELKALLGGKGANLAEMTNMGLNIPPGFIITTEACLQYFEDPQGVMETLRPIVLEYLKELEKKTGKQFGDTKNPLLVSVRSGAPMSMPGMMDTVLNLGLNDQSVLGLAEQTDNPRFSYDSYRRFIQMFGDVVMGIGDEKFERILNKYKREKGRGTKDTDLNVKDLQMVIADYKALYEKEIGSPFPQEPFDQLFLSIEAVFKSWNNKRAITYRKINDIPNFGTAVNIQTMVFGNKGWNSATGVAFSRDPSTGEKKRFGEYLKNAQGEDVVAGIRTPKKIETMSEEFPEIYKELMDTMEKLEQHYRDMQDIEFTIEDGTLFILQTRNGKRTPSAAVKIAVDMVKESLITKEEAILSVDAKKISKLLFKSIDENAIVHVLAHGINASPGAVSGIAIFDADTTEQLANNENKEIILVRPQTKPDDVHGLYAASGVLTQFGGKTSHAAVVARGMGKPAVVGAQDVEINLEDKEFKVGETTIREGDMITIDGTTGQVIEGKVPLIEPKIKGEFLELLEIADELRTIGVRANADTPTDAEKALEFGAEGIGLTRTEHMFMAQERLPVVQDMIMSRTKEDRQVALDKILPMQKGDFYEIFKIMKGKPVTIRLLDPPLHEFLPELSVVLLEAQELKMTNSLSKSLLNASVLDDEIKKKKKVIQLIRSLSEENPMMGLRGCRLGIVWPEINEMQVKAIFQAACELKKEGIDVKPEVMIPLVGMISELKLVKNQLVKVAKDTIDEYGVDLDYNFGTMIEIPRAALTADEIAKEAEFFSFGTNDLTQMTYGFSRDDAESKFLPIYLNKEILQDNPFEILDQKGVGQLMKIAIERGKQARPDLKCGICGEHGGEPQSINFAHSIGLNYVSCSPYRIPVARIAAAQAAIKEKSEN
ncbi:MAG: pyruvate, phosphate dikinase [Candidatus Lokiarchaeota archaeon]|nr:pyruvate, phosphate dikinase [Candidatus Lokiarchaeota archaeon]MBD3199695.1 pyruvate, phosphate dikinase [Candidatus Lokiarchaeota archaeon]